MDRKKFIASVGIGASSLVLSACLGGLSSCKKATAKVDFTLDVSTGTLASNGGYLVKDGVIVARTNSGMYIAVAAACTHEGTNVKYNASENDFVCPNHGAQFDNSGVVTKGPANTNLKKYNTSLSGSSLRVYS